jgi:hypothetical protein
VTLGQLCESVVKEFIKELEKLVDISEVETHQLHHLFTLVLSQVPTLFVVGKEKTQMPVASYVSSWEKFGKLTELLEARLKFLFLLFFFFFFPSCLFFFSFLRV